MDEPITPPTTSEVDGSSCGSSSASTPFPVLASVVNPTVAMETRDSASRIASAGHRIHALAPAAPPISPVAHPIRMLKGERKAQPRTIPTFIAATVLGPMMIPCPM